MGGANEIDTLDEQLKSELRSMQQRTSEFRALMHSTILDMIDGSVWRIKGDTIKAICDRVGISVNRVMDTARDRSGLFALDLD